MGVPEQVGHLGSGDQKVSELRCHGNQLNLDGEQGFCSTNRGELGYHVARWRLKLQAYAQ